jgi:hypothetical protein
MPALVAGIELWALPSTKQMSELGERPALRRTVFDWVALRRVVEQVNAGELCADIKRPWICHQDWLLKIIDVDRLKAVYSPNGHKFLLTVLR